MNATRIVQAASLSSPHRGEKSLTRFRCATHLTALACTALRLRLSQPGSPPISLIFAVIFLFLVCSPEARAQVNPSSSDCNGNQEFLIGVGTHDITGPAAGLGMMGYANIFQTTAGIHFRLRSRAFIMASPCNNKRVVFVSADLLAIFQVVKQAVVRKLYDNGYGALYKDENVLLSATHDHAGPGGYSHYWLYNLTVGGFEKENFQAIVDGIYDSILEAHRDLAPGTISIVQGETKCAPPEPTCVGMEEVISRNRSPKAYLLNPAEERAKYSCDTDNRMTLLKFVRSDAAHTEIGELNWFAVHGTSMHNNNRLISGDNKGYASNFFEKLMNVSTSPHPFVAAFAQSNEGDVTPNIGGKTNGCGSNDFESTMISGEKQFKKAQELYRLPAEPLVGSVDFRQTYVSMDKVEVLAQPPPLGDGFPHHTCTAAIGLSMLAGAEDGPGVGWQGLSCSRLPAPLSWICKLFTKKDHCQGVKPIAVTTGAKKPPWTPNILPIQLVRIGDLVIIAVPGEFTTMSGRRLRATVMDELAPLGIRYAVIAGLSNAYSGYVATPQEYDLQRYEGASTHFGPWTLPAYQQEFARVAKSLNPGSTLPPGPAPVDPATIKKIKEKVINRNDGKPFWRHFGDVHHNAKEHYHGGDTVTTSFWAHYPGPGLTIKGSFLQIEYQVCAEQANESCWAVVARDSDWETKFHWQRTLLGSLATVSWAIPQDAQTGNYRIRIYGTSAQTNLSSGLSRIFRVE
jgi:neutral ceramidase